MRYLLSVRGEFLCSFPRSNHCFAKRSFNTTTLFLQASHLASRSKLPNWVLLSISDAGEKAHAHISFAGFMPSAVVV